MSRKEGAVCEEGATPGDQNGESRTILNPVPRKMSLGMPGLTQDGSVLGDFPSHSKPGQFKASVI